MGTFGARLQSLVMAACTLDEIPLWPGEYVNDQTNDTGQHHQHHPQDRAVHAA
jgi:hypothetical protein